MNSVSLYEKREELKRLLESKYFAKAKKKSRFLEFVCEQTFLGNAEKLNEYLVGIEIYERGPGFNPQDDPIVRVQAHEIRRALKRYYEEEGKDSSLRIDLPPGHYVPVFSKPSHQEGAEVVSPVEPASGILFPTRTRTQRNGLVWLLAIGCLILGLLFLRERFVVRGSFSNGVSVGVLPKTMEWFWKPFLPPASPPLIVIPNHPLLRAAHEGDSPQTLAHSHLIDKEKLLEFRDTMHFRELQGFHFVASTTDFTAVGEALGLANFFEMFAAANQKIRVNVSRLVNFEEIRRGNAILLGGNQSWSGRIFLNPEGFWFHGGVIYNKQPRPGEQAVYKPEFDSVTNNLVRDYALVLMLPNERREERILLVYGIYTQGSQAAIEYVTNPQRLQELREALLKLSPSDSTPPRYFQVLLQTTVENFVPGKASLVSARIIPD
jgi:hypothetical protein